MRRPHLTLAEHHEGLRSGHFALGEGPAVSDIHQVSHYMVMFSEGLLEHQTEHPNNLVTMLFKVDKRRSSLTSILI